MKIEKPIVYKDKSLLPEGVMFVEAYDNSLDELFYIENPQFKKGMSGAEEARSAFIQHASYEHVWIYYPWRNTAVHTLPEEVYFKLRTSRNRNIILDTEQAAYRKIKVGIAGLSVGSAILSALVISGGPQNVVIADFDVLEVTNLNRLKATLLDVGRNKTEIAAQNVWEVDPFAHLELWDNGISKENLKKFIVDSKIDVFIDAMDSLELKIMARFICRENGIPVLMATDNGDGILLDVERYDLNNSAQIFNGLLGDAKPEDFRDMDYKMWLQLATKIVGPHFLTPRMQDSLLTIGKVIPSVPQLGTSANIAGSAVAYSVRRLAHNEELLSGRYVVSLEEKLIPLYMSEDAQKKRNEKTQSFIEIFSKK